VIWRHFGIRVSTCSACCIGDDYTLLALVSFPKDTVPLVSAKIADPWSCALRTVRNARQTTVMSRVSKIPGNSCQYVTDFHFAAILDADDRTGRQEILRRISVPGRKMDSPVKQSA